MEEKESFGNKLTLLSVTLPKNNHKSGVNTMPLGFKKKEKVQFIFIGKEQNCLWYFRQNNVNLPIEEDQLECVVIDIALGMSKSKTNPGLKLRIFVIADELSLIQVGADTDFAKNFLYKFLALDNKAVTYPLIIEVKTGDKSIVFCNLYSNGFPVKSKEFIPKYEETWDIQGIVEKVKEKIIFSRESLQPEDDEVFVSSPEDESPNNVKQIEPVPEESDETEDFVLIINSQETQDKDVKYDDIPF